MGLLEHQQYRTYFTIFFLYRVYFRILFFKIKKYKKTSVFPAQEISSWNSDTESCHRLTQTRLVRNALMHCQCKIKKRIAEKLPLTHIWDGGSGRGCVARQCCTHAQKICKKNYKNELISSGQVQMGSLMVPGKVRESSPDAIIKGW